LGLAGWALLPLRAFLGFTFCFAGLQKLANPGFLTASNPASIQSQLAGAVRRSPIHGLIAPLVHLAVPLGVLIAFAELAVGLGAILGLWTRLAAVGGMAISFALFLAVSFHSSPYYTGSDIVFVFAWTPMLVAGGGGVLSADAVLANVARRRVGAEPDAVVPIAFATVRSVCGSYTDGACQARQGAVCEPQPCPFLAQSRTPVQRRTQAQRRTEEEIDRRTFALKGAWTALAAAGGLLGGSLAAGFGRLLSSSDPSGTKALGTSASTRGRTSATASATSTPPTTLGGAQGTSVPTTTAPPQRHPSGTRIGPATDVPVGGAASFQDPSSGDPSLVVQPTAGRFLAFDAVCPHAGCVVQYDQSNKAFLCPCHGSAFNGQSGAVENGPATSGLARLTISKGPDGQLYVS
jgi:thiosulfate dehydrogenase [quinone] large subunit